MRTTALLRYFFKRFVSRKGIPQRIISDNGWIFKCAPRLLLSIVKQHNVSNTCNDAVA